MQMVVVEDSVLSDSIFLLSLQGFNATYKLPPGHISLQAKRNPSNWTILT